MKEIADIIRAYDAATAAGRRTALATVVHVEGSSYRRPGARMLVDEDGNLTGAISGGCLEGDARRKALFTIEQQTNKLATYDAMDPENALFGVQLGCNGIVQGEGSALFHYVPRTVSLVIAGAGNDAMPLAQMARAMGWHVTVIDGRPTHATPQRFPGAVTRLVKPGETPPPATAIILMSHNYPYDRAMLTQVLPLAPAYIGLLGPKARRDRLLDDLRADGVMLSPAQLATIHGPAGLDLGAETAEEIALSVIAQLKAVLMQRDATPLSARQDAIHERLGS